MDDKENKEKKERHKPNWWLEDSEFLAKANFQDHYYLETICKYVSNMIKNIPIPVLTSYDPKNKAIYFSVGKVKKGFKLDIDIAYYDYITLVKRWLYQFFPSYEIEYDIEEELNENEMAEKARKGMNLNDIIAFRKKVKFKEKGVIEKEVRLKDEFVLNVNGKKQIRITGSAQSPKSLSTFMNELKALKDDKKRHQFIVDNSRVIKELKEGFQDLNINYPGKQMLSFFEINFPDLIEDELTELEPFVYKWGKFKIKFESLSLKNDCLNYYNKEMSKIK